MGSGPDRRQGPKCRWLKPKLVAQIEYADWTDVKNLRHLKFIALRDDKPAKDVKREQPGDSSQAATALTKCRIPTCDQGQLSRTTWDLSAFSLIPPPHWGQIDRARRPCRHGAGTTPTRTRLQLPPIPLHGPKSTPPGPAESLEPRTWFAASPTYLSSSPGISEYPDEPCGHSKGEHSLGSSI